MIVFVNLDTEGTVSPRTTSAMPRCFSTMVAQSPTGELEVLPGKGHYTYAGNWKLQNENGLDGYHVSTVHNYVATVQHRAEINAKKGEELANTLDYRKLGAVSRGHRRAAGFSFPQRPQRAVQRHAQPGCGQGTTR